MAIAAFLGIIARGRGRSIGSRAFLRSRTIPAPMVALEMVARKVHRLFVTDHDGILVGVVTTSDIVRRLTFEA